MSNLTTFSGANPPKIAHFVPTFVARDSFPNFHRGQ